MLVVRVHSFIASPWVTLFVINWWFLNKSMTMIGRFAWYWCGEQVTLPAAKLSTVDDSTPSNSQSSGSLTTYSRTLQVLPWSIELSKLHMAGACFDPSNSIDNFAMWTTWLERERAGENERNNLLKCFKWPWPLIDSKSIKWKEEKASRLVRCYSTYVALRRVMGQQNDARYTT